VQGTNLTFTDEEFEVLNDRRFFLLKHAATDRMLLLFGELERTLKKNISAYDLPVEGLNLSSGKIFRGENYRKYPYVLLDYPRLFNTRTVFAMRTMFWWGNEFSITLHLQGEALEKYRNSIHENITSLAGKEVYYCVNDTPWQYHFGEDNYKMLDEQTGMTDFKKRLSSSAFIKLSRKLAITEYEKIIDYAGETMDLFLGMLKEK
jgi:hypothetical protein